MNTHCTRHGGQSDGDWKNRSERRNRNKAQYFWDY